MSKSPQDTKSQNSDDHAEYLSPSNIFLNDKSLTFRKRRLSLPLQQNFVPNDETESGEKGDQKQKREIETNTGDARDLTTKIAARTAEIEKLAPASPKTDQDNEEDEEDYGYETHEPDAGNYGTLSGSNHMSSPNDHFRQPQQVMIEMDNHSHHSAHSHPSIHSAHSSEAEDKAQTFRKRRLSMTTANSNSTGGVHGSTKSVSSGNSTLQVVAPDQFPDTTRKRQRRLSQDSSICSTNSFNSDQASTSGPPQPSSGTKRYLSRTLHAGELLPYNGMPPPSPAANADNVLYHQNPLPPMQILQARQQQLGPGSHPMFAPNNINSYSTQQLMLLRASGMLPPGLPPPQPRWKRRKTLCHQTEPHKLPFSVDVVGTYSCHGVEPVYDSEYDDDEDEIQGSVPIVTMAKINQDRGGVAYPYGNDPKTALFAVYDGHGQGGELVSQYALYEIQRRLEKHPKFRSDLPQALKETFLAVDDALNNEPLIEPLFAGTTACVAVYHNTKLTLANAGDSRAVLARRVFRGSRARSLSQQLDQSKPPSTQPVSQDYEYVAMNLTQDQNPDVPGEMERILSMGGYVSLPPAPGLSARVWLDPHCTQIGLAMSRSIGDHAVSPAGVIAEPVITTHEVTPEDDFIILASDGVWEFLTSAQAVRIVADNLERGATKACQALIEAAAARWHEEEGAYRDDITAIVVRLQHSWNAANGTSVGENTSAVSSTVGDSDSPSTDKSIPNEVQTC